MLIYIVEAIRHKKLSDKLEGAIHMVGFALLMVLMFLVLFNDITKLF